MASGTNGPLGKAPEMKVGVSDAMLLGVSAFGFLVLAGTIYSIVILRLKSAKEMEEEDENVNYEDRLANADVATLSRAQRRARAKHIMKQQRRAPAPALALAGVGADENGMAIEGPEALHDEFIPPAANETEASLRNLSRKQRQKAAKAAEREERRLFDEERRREQAGAEKVARQEKKERKREQALRTEEERHLREEQREADRLLAYQNWKTFLSSPDATVSISVKEWVVELQTRRVVLADELAQRFQIPKAQITSRIQVLLDSSRVTGAIESDGRFIYLSREELRTIADFTLNQKTTTPRQIADEVQRIISQ